VAWWFQLAVCLKPMVSIETDAEAVIVVAVVAVDAIVVLG
jgi:hypothetical protein